MCSKETQIATSMVWLDFYIITIVGYCGADLKALCTEAALLALRRRYPQIYQSSEKLQIDVASISINAQDFQLAMHSIIPASQRCVASPGKALGCHIRPLLQNLLSIALDALNKVFPVGSAQATSQDSKSKLSDKSKMLVPISLWLLYKGKWFFSQQLIKSIRFKMLSSSVKLIKWNRDNVILLDRYELMRRIITVVYRSGIRWRVEWRRGPRSLDYIWRQEKKPHQWWRDDVQSY